jgi:hypothetical protein
MAMSGIKVDPDIATLFSDIKLKNIHKYALFKIEKKKIIVVDHTGDPCKTKSKEEDEEQFNELKKLLNKEPRYILYDFGFTTKEGRKIDKLAFIFW